VRFRDYLAIVRKRGFLLDTDCETQAPVAGVPQDRVTEWLKDDHKAALIRNARAAFLASQPPPLSALPPFAAAETQPEYRSIKRVGRRKATA